MEVAFVEASVYLPGSKLSFPDMPYGVVLKGTNKVLSFSFCFTKETWKEPLSVSQNLHHHIFDQYYETSSVLTSMLSPSVCQREYVCRMVVSVIQISPCAYLNLHLWTKCDLVCYLPHLLCIESLYGASVYLRTDVALSLIFPTYDDRI